MSGRENTIVHHLQFGIPRVQNFINESKTTPSGNISNNVDLEQESKEFFTEKTAGPNIGMEETRDKAFDLEKQETKKPRVRTRVYVSVFVLLFLAFDRYLQYSSNGH